jgi:hypothetical protein
MKIVKVSSGKQRETHIATPSSCSCQYIGHIRLSPHHAKPASTYNKEIVAESGNSNE